MKWLLLLFLSNTVFGATAGQIINKSCSNHNWLSAITTSAAPVCSQPAYTDLSGSLPVPGAMSLGGVEAISCSAGQALATIGTDGIPVCSTLYVLSGTGEPQNFFFPGAVPTGLTGTENFFLNTGVINTTLTSGSGNQIVGNTAGANISSGSRITASGFASCGGVTTLNDDTCTGYEADEQNSGHDNTVYGSQALQASGAGSYITVVGSSAAYNAGATGSDGITCVGYHCLVNLSGGSAGNNTALGKSAGASQTSGTGDIYIGEGADTSTASISNSFVIGTGALLLNSNTGVLGTGQLVGIDTNAPGAQLHVVATTSTTVGAIIQGASSQTSNLLDFENNAGTVLARVSAAAVIQDSSSEPVLDIPNRLLEDPSGNQILNFASTKVANIPVQLEVVSPTATTVGTIMRGASAQSSDLTQWQNSSGTIFSDVTDDGRLGLGTDSFSSMLHVLAATSTTTGVTIQGAASQANDLLDFKNSAGTVLSYVDSNGLFSGSGTSFEFFTSSVVNADDAGTTSTTFVTSTVSPALTFTPAKNGTCKVYASIALNQAGTYGAAISRIYNTTGSATLLSESDGIVENVSNSEVNSAYTQSTYTVTGGISYVFDIQTKNNSAQGTGSNIVVVGAYAPFYMYAECWE